MIENMILMSHLNKSYFAARLGGYVTSIQMVLCDKLKPRGGGVTSTHNKRGCAILTAKVAPKNPGTYLKLRPKNPGAYLK